MALSFPFDVLYFKCIFRGNVTCTFQLLGKVFVSSKWHGRCHMCANFLMSEGAERLETLGGGAHLSLSHVHTYPPKPLCNLHSV